MAVYLVAYDLEDAAEAARYTQLEDAIMQVAVLAKKVQKSVWFVEADQSAERLAAALRPHMRKPDQLLVVSVLGDVTMPDSEHAPWVEELLDSDRRRRAGQRR